MENISLILIILIIGAVIGALLTGSNQRHYDDYYHNRYYHPPPIPYHGYRERPYGSGTFLFVLIVVSLFALILFFADRDPAAPTAPAAPARYGNTGTTPVKPATTTLRTCYLEIGRYPTWESANDAQRRLSVIHQQNLELVRGQSSGTTYHLVIGPFRGPEAAEAHMARHGLKARVVYFD